MKRYLNGLKTGLISQKLWLKICESIFALILIVAAAWYFVPGFNAAEQHTLTFTGDGVKLSKAITLSVVSDESESSVNIYNSLDGNSNNFKLSGVADNATVTFRARINSGYTADGAGLTASGSALSGAPVTAAATVTGSDTYYEWTTNFVTTDSEITVSGITADSHAVSFMWQDKNFATPSSDESGRNERFTLKYGINSSPPITVLGNASPITAKTDDVVYLSVAPTDKYSKSSVRFWVNDSELAETGTSCSFSVGAQDSTVNVAGWEINTYKINFVSGNPGVNIEGFSERVCVQYKMSSDSTNWITLPYDKTNDKLSLSVDHGLSPTFNITANEGYEFTNKDVMDYLTISDMPLGFDNGKFTCLFDSVDEDKTITINDVPFINYIVNFVDQDGNSISEENALITRPGAQSAINSSVTMHLGEKLQFTVSDGENGVFYPDGCIPKVIYKNDAGSTEYEVTAPGEEAPYYSFKLEQTSDATIKVIGVYARRNFNVSNSTGYNLTISPVEEANSIKSAVTCPGATNNIGSVTSNTTLYPYGEVKFSVQAPEQLYFKNTDGFEILAEGAENSLLCSIKSCDLNAYGTTAIVTVTLEARLDSNLSVTLSMNPEFVSKIVNVDLFIADTSIEEQSEALPTHTGLRTCLEWLKENVVLTGEDGQSLNAVGSVMDGQGVRYSFSLNRGETLTYKINFKSAESDGLTQAKDYTYYVLNDGVYTKSLAAESISINTADNSSGTISCLASVSPPPCSVKLGTFSAVTVSNSSGSIASLTAGEEWGQVQPGGTCSVKFKIKSETGVLGIEYNREKNPDYNYNNATVTVKDFNGEDVNKSEVGTIYSCRVNNATSGEYEIVIDNVTGPLTVNINLSSQYVGATFIPTEGVHYWNVNLDANNNPTGVGDECFGTVTMKINHSVYFAVSTDAGYDIDSLEVKNGDDVMTAINSNVEGRKLYSLTTAGDTTIKSTIKKNNYNIAFNRTYAIDGWSAPVEAEFLRDGEKITGSLSALHGQNTYFSLKIPDICSRSEFTVKLYDGSGNTYIRDLNVSNGVYNIIDVTSDYTVKVEDLALNKYILNFVANDAGFYTTTEDAAFSGIKNANHGSSYEFKVAAKTGYVIGESVAVNVRSASGGNQTLVPNSSGVYKIENITQDYTITVSNIDSLIYKLTLQSVPGVTYYNYAGSVVSGSIKVKYGGNFEFNVGLDDAYDESLSGMHIVINDGQSTLGAQKIASGRYMVSNITEDVTIKVDNVRKNRYIVTLTNTEGIDYYNGSGKLITGENEVEHQDDFAFKVNLYPAYKNSSFKVMLGNRELSAKDNGFYKITDIDENKNVTVAGVELTAEAQLTNTINGLPGSINSLEDVDEVIAATKVYESLSAEGKTSISNIEVLKDLQQQCKSFHHKSNDVTIDGADWHIKLVVVPISSDAAACARIYKKLTNEYILSLYDIYLWDTVNDCKYTLPEGRSVTVTVPTPDMTYFENPTGVHESGEGKINFPAIAINGNYTKFEASSFSPMGIIATRTSTPGRSSLLDAADANVKAIKDFALTSFSGGSKNSGTTVYNDIGSSSNDNNGDTDTGNISEQFKSRNNPVTAEGSALRLILVIMILILITLCIIVIIKNIRKRKKKSQ